jgi:SAM-dependent methyltransferase
LVDPTRVDVFECKAPVAINSLQPQVLINLHGKKPGEAVQWNGGSRMDKIARFYRARSDDEPNLFQIWEMGGARGDSITPSTFSQEYRRWMHDKLVYHLKRNLGPGLLSLGCGNATIEAELVRAGYSVMGVDAMPEAVELARAKGVEAICADLMTWAPVQRWPTVYLDGVLGHLYDPDHGLVPMLRRIRSWLDPGDSGVATLIVSNDDTKDGSPAQPASGVPGFYWLSAEFMRDQALGSGFDAVEVEHFTYRRPRSGDRSRSIIVAYSGSALEPSCP